MELSFWLEVSQARFVTALLIFARLGGVLMVAPLLSSRSVPPQIRVGLAVAFSLILTPLFPPIKTSSLPLLLVGLVKEGLVGLILGWLASLLFSCVQMAGEWLDLQAGFQAGQLFNPLFQTGTGALGNLKYILAGMVFLTVGGHGIVLRAAAESFLVSPPGLLMIGTGSVHDWFGFLSRTLWITIQIASPVGVTLFMTEMALSIVNRALPQLNVLMLSLPLKALLAVTVLAITIPLLSNALSAVFVNMGSALEAGIRVLGS